MKVAVIGAGPAGLTAAYSLVKAGVKTDVYEASDQVGGLARSLRLWNQIVDVGPHRFFSKDRRVNEVWLEVVGRDYSMVNRLTRIHFRNRFFRYPLQPVEIVTKLGVLEAFRCVYSYFLERFRPPVEESTFEEWVCSRFGTRLFEMFFKTYSEKLWGIPCDELDADFAAQRIKQFSLSAALCAFISSRSQRAHRTLVDQFAYPHEGTGMVYSRMAQVILKKEGSIFLNTPVEALILGEGSVKGIRLRDGSIREYSHVVSTMPLTTLVQRLPGVPDEIVRLSKQLTFRNTIIVYLELSQEDIFRDNWIYVHSPELRTGRITNFRNWSPTLYGENRNTIVAMEYWCNDGEELWFRKDHQLVELAARELISTGLVGDSRIVTNGYVYRVPKSYPVYRRGYKQILSPIQEYLRRLNGLHVIGRYGAFKYNNQDHSILMGIHAAENILNDLRNDLWAINSDFESYQEDCRITETGLVTA